MARLTLTAWPGSRCDDEDDAVADLLQLRRHRPDGLDALLHGAQAVRNLDTLSDSEVTSKKSCAR